MRLFFWKTKVAHVVQERIMTNAYQTYQQLVQRVEAFAQGVRQRYSTQITSQAGCDGCCYQQ